MEDLRRTRDLRLRLRQGECGYEVQDRGTGVVRVGVESVVSATGHLVGVRTGSPPWTWDLTARARESRTCILGDGVSPHRVESGVSK